MSDQTQNIYKVITFERAQIQNMKAEKWTKRIQKQTQQIQQA